MMAICVHCGKQIKEEDFGFWDKRLIHLRKEHPDRDIGLGWSFFQKLLVGRIWKS